MSKKQKDRDTSRYLLKKGTIILQFNRHSDKLSIYRF